MKTASDKKQLNGKEGMAMMKGAWTPPTATSTIQKTPVARVISVLPVPKPPKRKSLQVEDNTCPDLHTPKLMVRQRCGKLFNELDLSGLNAWAPELADTAHWLLAEYHDVFSLDPVGCTHSTEHAINVMDDTPFKE